MPNHVHALIEILPEHPLSEVLHSWKSYTSKEANKILGRKGTFWQKEFCDRHIRNDEHLANAIHYIEEENASDFSSAESDRRRPAGPIQTATSRSTT